MSLTRVNILIAAFLTIIIYIMFVYSYNITKNYFKEENIIRIRGDVLELGYSVATSMEQDGVSSSLNLLYRSLATHKEYQSLSIAIGDRIVVSTDKKQINMPYSTGSHINQLNSYSLEEKRLFFHEFVYFHKEKQVEFNLVIDLDDEYLINNEKEIQNLVNTFVISFLFIMMAFFLFIYFLNIRPLARLNRMVKEQKFSSSKFFIKEYSSLYLLFTEKYNEIALLNKTLEDKVIDRTKLLANTNELFNEAQRLTHIGNWEWNIVDNTVIYSQEMHKICGIKQQGFVGTYDTFLNVIHVDDRTLVEEAINKALKSGKSYEVRHRIVLPDSKEKVVYEKGRVTLDSDNKPVRMIGTMQDITESFKAEQELELQSRVLNSVTDSIFVHKLDGSFIYVNEAAYMSIGYEKEELLDKKIQDFEVYEENISEKEYREEINKQIKEKGHSICEISHKAKNEILIPLEVTTRLIHEDNNEYMISIARDITERKAIYKNLKLSEEKYRKLVQNSQIGIFKSKLTGEIVYVNDSLLAIMGYESQEEIYEKHVITMYKDPEQYAHFLRALIQDGQIDKIEIEVITKDNEYKTILMSAHIEEEVISGIVMDITESKKAVDDISKLSKAIEEIDDVIMITDRAGVLTFVNDAYVAHTGFSREESIGKTAAILKSGKHDKNYYKNMWKEILSGNVYRGLIINRKKDGELYYEEKTITPIKNEIGIITSFVSTGKDITQHIEMQHTLEKLASTDQLTGIYNRRKFEEMFNVELDRISRYKSPLALIMFDVDHFKSVNDTYGHDVGDKVLKSIVNVVNKNIRNTDIFARWGGEEFLILSPETNSENARALAEKLRASIEKTKFVKAGKLTCSFGVSSYIDKESGDSLIKRVDDALYEAKNEGRNRVNVI